MKRIAVLSYGLICYLMFFGVFIYAIGFIGNIAVPKSLDSAPTASLPIALAVNCTLLALFALQHSGMARPTFKRWWAKFVPVPIERSTYVLASNIAMILLFYFWEPMGGVVWHLENQTGRAIIYGVFALGWLTVFYATCLVSHFDLFGLRQVYLYFKGKHYTQLPFRERALYRYVRHPLYVGWITVMWSAPTMTVAHLLFAVGSTAYILIAIRLEERNLVDLLPGYSEYRKRVPMLLPKISHESSDLGRVESATAN